MTVYILAHTYSAAKILAYQNWWFASDWQYIDRVSVLLTRTDVESFVYVTAKAVERPDYVQVLKAARELGYPVCQESNFIASVGPFLGTSLTHDSAFVVYNRVRRHLHVRDIETLRFQVPIEWSNYLRPGYRYATYPEFIRWYGIGITPRPAPIRPAISYGTDPGVRSALVNAFFRALTTVLK